MEQISASDDLLQFVGFTLANEEYAVDILKVQEIIRMSEIARVPNAPSYVAGVINLRGRVIPVVSLRDRFGFPEKEMDERTRIIIMEIGGITVGALVDAVSEVMRIPSDTVEEAPNMASGIRAEFIKGIANLDERLVILVDMNRLIEHDESDSLTNIINNK